MCQKIGKICILQISVYDKMVYSVQEVCILRIIFVDSSLEITVLEGCKVLSRKYAKFCMQIKYAYVDKALNSYWLRLAKNIQASLVSSLLS